jgi:hypothetical protein
MPGTDTLAIIAGGGQLPLSVAESARDNGRNVFVVALDGFADADFAGFAHTRLRIGQVAAIDRELRAAGCRDVVLIGVVRRPGKWRSDVGLSLIWTLLANLDVLWRGDSALLSRIVRLFERHGYTVRGAHEIAPQLLLPVGDHARTRPGRTERGDIEIGIRAVRALGQLDIGQCVVVARGRVLAVEAAEGTDAMLERVASLNRHAAGRRLGVLVKWPQPIQDLRVDMPTIGPDTVRLAAAAGLAGIAVAGTRVLAVKIDEMIETADRSGMFLTALDPDEAAGTRS